MGALKWVVSIWNATLGWKGLVHDFFYLLLSLFPAGIFLLKINNRNIRIRYEIYSKLTIKAPERRYWLLSGVVNFKHISHLVLVFLLLTLNMQLPAGLIDVIEFNFELCSLNCFLFCCRYFIFFVLKKVIQKEGNGLVKNLHTTFSIQEKLRAREKYC